MKLFLLILFLSGTFSLQAGVKICAHCGKGSRYMRYSAENRHFCSEKCAAAQIGCSNCKSIPKGQYMIIMGINGEHKRFCGRCSRYKKCFSCFFPSSRNRHFSDGRVQCMTCRAEVLSPQQTRELLQQLRYDLYRMYGYDPRHRITLRLVSQNALRKISGSRDAMGCMKVQVVTQEQYRNFKKEVKKEWQCVLYILDNLPRTAAAKVMVHELTHDYLYHHAGGGKDPKIVEGICEAVSGEWLRRNGYKGYFEAMKKNPDPVYGAGFRLIFPQLKRYGLKGVLQHYRSKFTPL